MTDLPDRPTTKHELKDARPAPGGSGAVPRRRRRRWLAAGLAAAVLVVAVAAGLVVSGVGGDRLRLEAERALTRVLGEEIAATVGSVRLALDADRFLSLELVDAGLAESGSEAAFLNAGSIRVGMRLRPLLEGRFRLGSAAISDATIVLDRLPQRGGPGPFEGWRNAAGLIDPDLAVPSVFALLHHAFDAVHGNAIRHLSLENVRLVLDSSTGTAIELHAGVLERRADGRLDLTGSATFLGRDLSFEGQAARDSDGTRISSLDLTIELAPVEKQAGLVGFERRIGAAHLRLSGAQPLSSAADRLQFAASFEDTSVRLSPDHTANFTGRIAGHAVTGAGKVEISELVVATDHARWNLEGAVGPSPATRGEAPSYRFEFVSNDSRLGNVSAAAETVLGVRVAGNYLPDAEEIVFRNLDVRTVNGEVAGSGRVSFETGKTPGLLLELDAAGLTALEAKRLWPWFAADKAREWAVDHVLSGRIASGTLRLETEPGRFGNGIPFTDEVGGTFVLEDAEMALGGELPPLRDASGRISFSGQSVEVAVDEARARLASGKWIDGHDGTVTVEIERGEAPIVNLMTKVAADADAALEFASLAPINADRHIDFAAGDLSGHVAGDVTARFPVGRKPSPAEVSFDVDLDFTDVDIAKEIQGQTVTDASGHLRLRPSHAEITAEALLNGVGATIDLVEPIGDAPVERQRLVELELDDDAREELLPALSTLLSGEASVALDLSSGEHRSITADLSSSTLKLPWIGWSKGAGITATTAFQMERSGGQTFLHDFGLKGETFGAGGTVTLDEAGLLRASLPQVRLNRGDDIAVDIRRAGNGYAIDVTGSALDARSIIKTIRAAMTKPASEEGEGPAPVTIELDLDVAEVTGFGDVALRDVKVAYRGSGSTIENLDIEAVTPNGGSVSLIHGLGSAGRFARLRGDDAGALLKFLGVYMRMEGGRITAKLEGAAGGALVGRVDLRDFALVDEPRLKSLVSSPSDRRGRSLNDVVRADLNVSRVSFERAFAFVEIGKRSLSLSNGIIRGPQIGSTFQGTVFDANGQMSLTGTFMPAYGVNRLFGEIPLIGQILGNGRDGGLIGITFKLAGDVESPDLQVNPLSAIAPGIFRSVFEFR